MVTYMVKYLFIFLAVIGIFFMTKLPANESKPNAIILLGPPGAGKGTHAVKLSKELNVPHISTGDIFRYNIKNHTALGEKAKSYMDKGNLVPDEIVNDMLFDRISQDDCKKGYILDGFPRTLDQAKALDKKINGIFNSIIVNINVSDSMLVDRVVGRLVCTKCGAPYHVANMPPKKEGVCDLCQGELIHRKDDTEEVVKTRLKVYHDQTEKPLFDYYGKKVIQIDGEKTQKTVFDNLISALK